jgi:site-specific recombinase XerD
VINNNINIKTTINQAINFFMNYLYANNNSKQTIVCYTTDLNIFKNFVKSNFTGVRYIQQLRLSDLNQYLAHLRKQVEHKEIQAATMDRRVFSLRSFYSFLYDDRLLDYNPASKLKYKKSQNKSVPNYLEEHELDHLFKVIENTNDRNKYRDIAIFACLRYLGARRTEVTNLKWSDIHFTTQQIKIYREKTNTYSLLPMHPKLVDALLQLYNATFDKTKEYVFISRQGNQLSKTAFNSVINKYVNLASINKDFKITARIFRHTFCTIAAKKNIASQKIMEFTGHKSADTLSIYSKMNTSHLSDLLAAM